MHPHNLLPPARIVALGGPVTHALAAMRSDPYAVEVERIRALRQRIEDRIAADLELLDALDGDVDQEADFSTVEAYPAGGLHTLGRSSDDEPSLCGVGTHDGGSRNLWQGYPQEGGNCGDSPDDLEHDDADGPEGDDEREHDEAERGIADTGGLWEQFEPWRRGGAGFAFEGPSA